MSAAHVPVDLAQPRVETEPSGDGGLLLRSTDPLRRYEPHLGVLLRHWAAHAPDRTFVAERRPDGAWRQVSYAEANRTATRLGQALLGRGLDAGRPLLVLSGNSVDHALLSLGAMLAGVPVVPISPAYSLHSRDYAKLRLIAETVRPGLVYAQDPTDGPGAAAAADRPFAYAGAVAAVAPWCGGAVTSLHPLLDSPGAATAEDLERALAGVGPDTVAKVLFTSGSTGTPKGVLNTHRMLCANQQMIAQVWPFAAAAPPVLVDWLPWSHTFGGNHNLNLALKHGGSLYVDGGRPAPGLVETTARNVAEIGPTVYFNVPAGYGMLLPHLESDPRLAAGFLRRLQLIFYAGAGLPQPLWDRLEALSLATVGRRVLMTSSWGTTETAPAATSAHYPLDRAGVIGVPLPGLTIKVTRTGEICVRGPSVSPGYLGEPDLTAAAFDSQGFFRSGDAVRLADPADPARGLVFDGRIAESFKLATGTWVQTGAVRVAALSAAAPLLSDALVTGQDRTEIGLLAWVSPAGLNAVAGGGDPASTLASPAVVEHLRRTLSAYNTTQPGSSTRVGRVLLLSEPPSIDAGEITDKGYLNQRAGLRRRADQVDWLYAEPLRPGVVTLGAGYEGGVAPPPEMGDPDLEEEIDLLGAVVAAANDSEATVSTQTLDHVLGIT